MFTSDTHLLVPAAARFVGGWFFEGGGGGGRFTPWRDGGSDVSLL